MRRRGVLRLSLLPLAALAAPALAQTRREQRTLYRCGNTLSDRPCGPEAAGSDVAYDEPSDADRRAALARARAEQQRGAQQAREREAAERAALRANRPPTAPPAPGPTASRPAPEPRVRHARGPKPRAAGAPSPAASR